MALGSLPLVSQPCRRAAASHQETTATTNTPPTHPIRIPNDSLALHHQPKTEFHHLLSTLQTLLGTSGLASSPIAPLWKALEEYNSNAQDWGRFVFFDEKRYTRNLVDDGNGGYNILALAWGPGMKSPIHDHANSHCLMKVLHGSLIETKYDWPSQETLSCLEETACEPHVLDGQGGRDPCLSVKGETRLERNGVTYIHDKIGLHRVANASSTEPAVSLHIYTPPITECHTFEESTGRMRPSCCAVFHSKFGCCGGAKLKKWDDVVA